MSSVQQKLFPLSLAEAWDTLYALPPHEVFKNIDLANGEVYKSRSCFKPHQGTKIKPWDQKRESHEQYVSRVLYTKLLKIGLSELNDVYRREGHKMSVGVLSFLLMFHGDDIDVMVVNAALEQKQDDYFVLPATRPNTHRVHRQSMNAAQRAIEVWKPEFDAEMRTRASEAGKKGKKYNLDSHLATAHLSVTAAAKALGVARGTVYAMRREYADLDVTTGEVQHAEEETAQETARPIAVESDRLGRETRDESRSSVDGLADALANGSAGQNSSSSQSSGVAKETSGVLLDLEAVDLPF